MYSSDKDIWETSTNTLYDHVLMAVEISDGVIIYGKSVTLSRSLPLYLECGYPPIVPITTIQNDTISIPCMFIQSPLDELVDTHEALENLRGYPVEVWSWKIHSDTEAEAVNVPPVTTKAPLLFVYEDTGGAYVLGQLTDINTIIHTCAAFDVDVLEMWDGNTVTGFKVEAKDTSTVADLIQSANYLIVEAGRG